MFGNVHFWTFGQLLENLRKVVSYLWEITKNVFMYCKNIFYHLKIIFLFLRGHVISSTALYHVSFPLLLILRFSSDPLKTSQGMLSLKVFRLSDKMMTMYKDAEFNAER